MCKHLSEPIFRGQETFTKVFLRKNLEEKNCVKFSVSDKKKDPLGKIDISQQYWNEAKK